MANITKTIIFPTPTEWIGQEQSTTTVGIATYEGPEQIVTDWRKGENPPIADRIMAFGSKDAECPVAVDCVRVTLDAVKYPLHALNFWGQKYRGTRIVVDVGPADVDNPDIADPHDFQEVFDQQSFYWDEAANDWSTGSFKVDGDLTGISTEGVHFGWDWVRAARDKMLDNTDGRVAANDTPDSVKAPWLQYRQTLRDIPTDWAGVGTATHLIVWPKDPDEVGRGVTHGANPNPGY